jgi:hypothetical protein
MNAVKTGDSEKRAKTKEERQSERANKRQE